MINTEALPTSSIEANKSSNTQSSGYSLHCNNPQVWGVSTLAYLQPMIKSYSVTKDLITKAMSGQSHSSQCNSRKPPHLLLLLYIIQNLSVKHSLPILCVQLNTQSQKPNHSEPHIRVLGYSLCEEKRFSIIFPSNEKQTNRVRRFRWENVRHFSSFD